MKKVWSTWLGINSKEKYSMAIDKTLKWKDSKISLNEFFVDNSRIIINFHINKEVDYTVKNHFKLVSDVYIHGKKVERKFNNVSYRVLQSDKKNGGSNVTLEIEGKDLSLNNKEDVKLVFSNLAKECKVSDSKFTYSFVYDSTNYKNHSKVVKVNKNIIIGENKLSLDSVTVTPDRIYIKGFSKGFTPWGNDKDYDYYYDILDQNNNLVPLKKEIGNEGFFYKNGKLINTFKIIPYTFKKIDTNKTFLCSDGRTKYFIESKSIIVNLK